jgi:hypothetical protein
MSKRTIDRNFPTLPEREAAPPTVVIPNWGEGAVRNLLL